MVRTKSSVPTRDRDTASEILVLLFITVGLGLTLTGTLGFLFNFPGAPVATETARLAYGFTFAISGVIILVLASAKWTRLNGRSRESGHDDD